ncbi:MAG TPA: sigma 54-interacting transcriptional regulator [Bacillota bacterium]|nr:sigma 54-interacting transcriptional regulator [Bacillota bacterium]
MRIKINTADRVGMVLDVLQVFAARGWDIQAMEVVSGAIFVRIRGQVQFSEIRARLLELSGVHSVAEISSLPQEERHREIQAIVEAVSEGLMAVDAQGRITLLNKTAESILNLQGRKVLGKNVAQVLSPDVPMLRTLKTGQGYDNQEIVISRGPVRTRYMTSGRPLINEEGKVCGVVASLKDPGQIRALVHSVTRAQEITFANILYRSRVMGELLELARRVAETSATILIYGESGTGKELLARAIHAASPRRDMPFVPINCGALPDALLESELFGYEDGAFTGSRRGGRMGLFEFAHGGTVFLDEIAELPTHLQAKLLRALQSGHIRRVGGNEEIQVDVRIMAATNQDLVQLVREHKFREDLFYRLNVIPLTLPPLRQRREDIEPIVQALLARHQAALTPEAMAVLRDYHWPGNVRELENVLERAAALAGASAIEPRHLLLDQAEAAVAAGRGTLKEQVAELERKAVAAALRKYGSTRRAGEALGLSHTSIRNKVKRYGLERYISNRKD